VSDEGRDRPVRLGLAGCGRLAEAGYLPAFERLPRIRLAAVADPDPRRRSRVAGLASRDRPQVATHACAADLIAAGGVDGLVIASPPEAHLDAAVQAADASLPALVEKPPAPDGPLAARLAALEPRPWIGFNRRFDRAATLRERVPPGGGVELELELRYRQASWRAYTVAPDALADLGPHLVDLALFLTRTEPRAVRRAALEPARARLELLTGRGVARIRCETNRVHRERVRVRTPDGAAIADHAIGGPMAGALARLRRRAHPLVDSLALQLEAFARTVRGESPGPLADAADGARVMAALDAARASARRAGAEVAVHPASSVAGRGTGTDR